MKTTNPLRDDQRDDQRDDPGVTVVGLTSGIQNGGWW
jgi:hypothetical protein